MKVRPIKGDRPGVWSFTEKWLLRQAVRPYVTDELFERRKFSYNAPPERPSSPSSASNINDRNDMLTPLPALFKNRITVESVARLGLFDWGVVERIMRGYLAELVFQVNGMLDPRAQVLMYVLSFIVMGERFGVPAWSVVV
jgi:asparagine synthase (glutamine-hydrolysing)